MLRSGSDVAGNLGGRAGAFIVIEVKKQVDQSSHRPASRDVEPQFVRSLSVWFGRVVGTWVGG